MPWSISRREGSRCIGACSSSPATPIRRRCCGAVVPGRCTGTPSDSWAPSAAATCGEFNGRPHGRAAMPDTRKEDLVKRLAYVITGMLIGGVAVAAASHAAATTSQDPVKLSPQYYTVKLENDRVRVFEYRLRPGDREPMHVHPPYVAYMLSDGKIRLTSPDGNTAETTMTKGQVAWRDALSHATENVGSTEIH